MQKPWLDRYPTGVPHEIKLTESGGIADAFSRTCKSYGHKKAFECMGASLSFAEFEKSSDAFASYLQNVVKLKHQDRIAIMLPNVLQFPVAFVAAQKLGLSCVNTNPQYTAREMLHQFKDSGATTVVILDLFMDKLEEIISQTSIRHVIVTSIGDQLSFPKSYLINTILKFKGLVPKHSLRATSMKDAINEGKHLPWNRPQISPDDIAILQYTGGTTGVPKAAMLTQRNILANMSQIQAWASAANIGSDEVILTALPLYHIFALTVNFLSFSTMGGCCILVPKPVPIANTVKIFKKYRITVMTGVNTLYNALNNDPQFQQLRPRTLKIALAGGMALQEPVAKAWYEITGNRIIEGFGMTESSPVTHCNPPNRHDVIGSIGLPLPSTEARIVDENGQEVPIGQDGELVIRGPQVMKGYWQRPDETEKTIKDGWLYTGDICRANEDGYFYVVDRKKDMILVSGFNVYPNEIEEVLASHPKVLEAAVIGIPDASAGEQVKAFIVKKDPSLSQVELSEYCKKELTGYKRPRTFEFVSELPKSNIGKILRRHLRDQTNSETPQNKMAS